MTIVSVGSDDVIEQITKHLNRLIEVVKVVDLTEADFTERELMLIKVRAVGKEREEMKRMADIFRGRVIDVTERTTRSSSPATPASSTRSSAPSTARRSSRPYAPAVRASVAASAFCASDAAQNAPCAHEERGGSAGPLVHPEP